MAKSYGESQRKYYQKNKDSIYRRHLKWKTEYNKKYYEKNKELIETRKKLRDLAILAETLYKVEEST